MLGNVDSERGDSAEEGPWSDCMQMAAVISSRLIGAANFALEKLQNPSNPFCLIGEGKLRSKASYPGDKWQRNPAIDDQKIP